MKSCSTPFALLISLALACTTPPRKPAGPDFADPLVRSTYLHSVAISVTCLYPDGPKREFGGSGTIISNRNVLTARHVVGCDGGSAWRIAIETFDGIGIEMRVVKTPDYPWQDSALLGVVGTREFKSWARVSKRDVRLGEKVCGGWAVPWRGYDCGFVQAYQPHDATWWGAGCYTLSIQAVPGMSGSGVFDQFGRLVGVLIGGRANQAIVAGVDVWSRALP